MAHYYLNISRSWYVCCLVLHYNATKLLLSVIRGHSWQELVNISVEHIKDRNPVIVDNVLETTEKNKDSFKLINIIRRLLRP